MNEERKIRFDRSIDIEWLDTTAALVADNADGCHIRSRLFEILGATLSGGQKQGTACYKAVSVLYRSWVSVPRELEGFRNRASKVFPTLDSNERLALHWAMLLANYPFFGDVARHAGRLLALQGNCSLSQITRRIHETWGDRSTANRAVRRIVRSMVQWNALADTKVRGVYTRVPERTALNEDSAKLLLEGLLRNQGRPLPVGTLDHQPTIFPFKLGLHAPRIQTSQHLEIFHQGLNKAMVAIVPDRS